MSLDDDLYHSLLKMGLRYSTSLPQSRGNRRDPSNLEEQVEIWTNHPFEQTPELTKWTLKDGWAATVILQWKDIEIARISIYEFEDEISKTIELSKSTEGDFLKTGHLKQAIFIF